MAAIFALRSDMPSMQILALSYPEGCAMTFISR